MLRFEAALEIFNELRVPLWPHKAREGRRCTGVRSESGAGLTPTGRRVAELVAEGHTNKEVADALFASLRTVESNLTRVYQKLGIRSRSELARSLAAPQRPLRGRPVGRSLARAKPYGGLWLTIVNPDTGTEGAGARFRALITFTVSLSGDLRKRPYAQRSDANTYHGDALPTELTGREIWGVTSTFANREAQINLAQRSQSI